MRTVVANAVAALHTAVEVLAGEAAKVRVDGTDVPLTVVLGRRESIDSGDESVVAHTSQEIFVDPAQLLDADGNSFDPAHGMLILLEAGGAYRVSHYSGEKCWRWNDQTKTRMRVHTVEVKQPTDAE